MNNRRKILISGATSGIGLAISQGLLQRGHQVVALGRHFDQLTPAPAGLTTVEIDLGQLDHLPEKLKQLARDHGDIDGLICCAGKGQFGSLEEFSFEQMRQLIDLNFTSQAWLSRAFLPALKQRQRADIIYIGSEAALSGGRRGAIYCASKFALRGMAQALREECGRSGVHICTINPGMVKTPFFDDLAFAPGDDALNYIEPEDVAEAVMLVLESRAGTVVDEINLSPLKRVIKFNKK